MMRVVSELLTRRPKGSRHVRPDRARQAGPQLHARPHVGRDPHRRDPDPRSWGSSSSCGPRRPCVVVSWLLGIYLIVAGVFQLVQSFTGERSGGIRAMLAIGGVLSLVLGMFAFRSVAHSVRPARRDHRRRLADQRDLDPRHGDRRARTCRAVAGRSSAASSGSSAASSSWPGRHRRSTSCSRSSASGCSSSAASRSSRRSGCGRRASSSPPPDPHDLGMFRLTEWPST